MINQCQLKSRNCHVKRKDILNIDSMLFVKWITFQEKEGFWNSRAIEFHLWVTIKTETVVDSFGKHSSQVEWLFFSLFVFGLVLC